MADPTKEENLHNDFYAKYVGCYAKRFYQPFTKETLRKIIAFELRPDREGAYFQCKDDVGNKWWWDIDDCVIITNNEDEIEDQRIASVHDKRYNGYNPYLDEK